MGKVRVLVFGDAHIPTRRDSIPKTFYQHIEGTDYDFALVTGDLVREESMRAAMPRLPKCYFVMGNMDYGRGYKHHEQMDIEDFNFLLMHGTQLRPRGNLQQYLEILMRVSADVGVHGHTHKSSIDLLEGHLFLNPGTVSGATGGWTGKVDASFIELEVSGTNLRVVLHYTDWNTAKQSDVYFKKKDHRVIRCR